MEIIREGPSASRPPVLDGKNYSYWKPQMIFFIKTLDGKAWRALVAGYDPPMITANGVSVPKLEVDWTDAEEQASVGNARARNAIFNGVDLNIFKLINSCSTAKEAWKTLEVAYEGTSKVKISRLQLITSKFEALRMTEDESVCDYNKRVLEIANESLLLGEKIPDSKIVRKVLRSLPRKFDMKVTAIEEAHDITTLKLDELFGSLLTFEMAIADRESMNVQTSNQYQRRNDDGPTRRNNENSDRRSDGYLKKKEGTENLDSILKAGHNGSYRYGLGFVASASSSKTTSEIKFVPASMRVEYDTIHTETGIRTLVKSLGRTCYYCSRKGHIRSYFTNLNDCVTRHVTFGDGAKGKIIAKGNIDKDDLPRLNDVRKLGHVSMRGLEKVIKNKAVVRIYDLDVNGNFFCGDYQIGKQTRSTHKSLKECYTNRVLEQIWISWVQCKQKVLKKWDARSEQGIFLGYSQNSRAYRVYNNRSNSVMETINVVINDLDYAIKQMNDEKDKTSNMSETRRKDKIDYLNMVADLCYISTIELSTVDSALKDDYWLNAMQEKLLQFRRNNVWTLVSKPEGVNVIGTKWIFKNKTDETGCVTKNKAKLVVQGYTQVEGVDFDETFAPIARLKAIRLLLGISCIQKFKLYQIDVKSAFLNGYLNEEVYVAQPKGFVDSKHPKHVYKLNKALYGLKQAPRAWYDQLTV
ncbi:putative mitochondrial protein [Cucumis melo var. makuwa]|uniref:Mitochondrial protein n=1 Tax=Cucumis melo var. makuwa TaxID=1194695 RepID=A0A5A7UJR8_CUCMM|nr:putative mitochondrial protein [Cucumis melo var. makuwa]